MDLLETEIGEWRDFVAAARSVDDPDVEELETHLREQIGDLVEAGLAADEAFLVAVKRMGSVDAISQEFAREHSGRLWKQLVTDGVATSHAAGRGAVALLFAIAAAVAIQIVRLADSFSEEEIWFARNAALIVLAFLAAYFAKRRRLPLRSYLLSAIPFATVALVVNLYPFAESSATGVLVAVHLPVVLWFVVAFPYMGGTTGSHERRMDFIRFTGEWFIYYVLIALGGAVLLGLTALILEPTGVADVEELFEWILPSGAAGAVIVAAWLVESKQRVVENMAPVLTMLFTPLFAVMIAGAAVIYAMTSLGDVFDRQLLGVFDALLIVVLGLVLYGMSARDPSSSPAWMDRIQLATVVAALGLDLVVLGAIVARVGELGFTPNRTAALGLNVLLLVSLAGTAWLSSRFIVGKTTFHRLESWQTSYLPIFALWSALMIVVLPPLFAFA